MKKKLINVNQTDNSDRKSLAFWQIYDSHTMK